VRILNTTRHSVIAASAQKADTAWARLRGLLGRSSLSDDEALAITDCRSIHMFFMRFAIDVIFVDREQRVVGLAKNIRPFQMSRYYFRSCCAIEGAVGMIERSQTERGDIVSFEEEKSAE